MKNQEVGVQSISKDDTLSESAHTIFKKYLLDLGKGVNDSKGKLYYYIYSGDSELLDISFKKRCVDYLPDIVWKRNIRAL
jgi:hypothetical protein